MIDNKPSQKIFIFKARTLVYLSRSFLGLVFPHEIWNSTDEIRVILFMDIVRPCKFPVSLLNHLSIYLIRWSPFIQDAYRNQKKWDKRLERILQN
jgi:hypothetical protein